MVMWFVGTTVADASREMGRFVLTGSQNLLMAGHVSQSLAGRAGYLELLPLGYAEAPNRFAPLSVDALMCTGFYPALHDRPLAATDWHASYLATYVERDVRQISRIADLLQFQRFMRMMAARAGQMLNLNALAHDLGIAQTTARDWLSVLEASYVVFRLPPFFGNFGKRLVKTPKVYDTRRARGRATRCWSVPRQGTSSTKAWSRRIGVMRSGLCGGLAARP